MLNGGQKHLMKKIELPADYALVLRLIKRAGQEEMSALMESLGFDRARLMHIIQNLRHKGLIRIRRAGHNTSWVRLSSKGWRTIALLSQQPSPSPL
jgi:DNA-binding MarR family transcriptional regulator